jgi:DNA gyrase subunit A
MTTRSEDEVTSLYFARTLDYILFFTDKGRVYSSRVYELPEGGRTARGAHIANVLNLMPDETVSTVLVTPDFAQAKYVTLITRQARIKRMELSVFSNVRSTGVIAMSLDPDDSLDWARLTNGDEEFLAISRHGKALRFHERSVRPMGRSAAGVMAMRLLGDDAIVSLDVVKRGSDLFVLHERGWGKRTPVEEFNAKGRYTQGNWATDHRRLDEIGPIVAARVVRPGDEITVITAHGIMLRTSVAGISRMGRSTRGVRIVNLEEGDSVAALAVITQEDLTRGVDGGVSDEASVPGGSDTQASDYEALDESELDDEMSEGMDEDYLDEASLEELTGAGEPYDDAGDGEMSFGERSDS